MPYWEAARLMRSMVTDFGRGIVYGMCTHLEKYERDSLMNIAMRLNGGKSA